MKSLKYIKPDTIEEAISNLNQAGAKVVAGGTDLLGSLKDKINPEYPKLVVGLKGINGLSYLREDSAGLKIGAMTNLSVIQDHPILKEKYALLAKAAHTVASPQIRNMATVGGNICQEPRCWYYRYLDNGFNCLRKGGDICNAFTGENTYHSIFGSAKICPTPCEKGCPNGTEIPGYFAMIREGDLDGAARLLLEVNPMPAVTGRVCPHFCQDECNRNLIDEKVSIRDIEKYVGDYILEDVDKFVSAPAAESGKNIAVIGAGPAGLAAAFYLRQNGHKVTVFDVNEEVGGMLTYAIPAYRLPKDIVKRVAGMLKSIGVQFKLGKEVDKNATVADYKKKFDIVFAANGAWGKNSINVHGEELTLSGLDFLYNISVKKQEKPGDKVVVIGGGNVAVDVAISALRLGAKEVTMACLESRAEMPAWEHELAQAVEEGVKLMPGWGPSGVIGANGKVSGIEFIECTAVFNEQKRFAPTYNQDNKITLDADCVILAVGQRTELGLYGDSVKLNGRVVAANEETQATSLEGVYAAGDIVTGPASVVEAIAGGRKAAKAINLYLGGTAPAAKSVANMMLKFDCGCLEKSESVVMPTQPIAKRALYQEDAVGMSLADISKEASRCFNCGCVAVSPSDLAPALIALGAKIKTSKRTIDAEQFFLAGISRSTILDTDEIVTEIEIPAPAAGNVQVYEKFRLRKSIDFPVAGVAANLTIKTGKVSEARIVLGAVMPVPKRVREVEDYLLGKEITQEVAEAASMLAIKDASALEKNGYKVNVIKALVKRAILAAAK